MVKKPEDHLTLNAEDGEALIARVHRSNLPRADAEQVEWVIRTNPAMTSVTPVCTLADLILYAPTRTALIAA